VGIGTSARYRVDIAEVYDAQSTFTYEYGTGWSNGLSMGPCSGADGLSAGTSLELQATGTTDDRTRTCELITASVVSAPPQIALSGPSNDSLAVDQARAGESLMYAVEAVTVNGCSGSLALDVLSGLGAGGPFSEPVPGHLPPALLYALFLPSTTTCQACEDNFVIHFTKE
jgi:hypothetical protein